MSYYYSGAEVLSEARLRRAKLGDSSGIAIVEGRNDLRLLLPACTSQAHVLPAGNKKLVLQAASRLRPEERDHFVLVVDCDFDVPAGSLKGEPHLILTKTPAVESDLVDLGIVDLLVLHLVPKAADGADELRSIADVVVERAVALAGAIGQLRQLSATENLGLNFKDLRLRKMRRKGTSGVDFRKLVTTVLQRSNGTLIASEVEARASLIQRGVMTCDGHDLVESIAAVLHEDFGVPLSEMGGLDKLLRSSASNLSVLEKWSVIERIQAWQQRSGRKVLAI